MHDTEVVIVGSGIIGLTIARELLKRGCEKILILEKESQLGVHASGRNSGILHAGVYYTPDSLKAKSCLRGNMLMSEFCTKNHLPYLKTGKVIVVKSESELETLAELERRARANGASVEMIDEKTLKELEPSARTVKKALWVKNTATVDPRKVLEALAKELESSGKVTIRFNCMFKGVKSSFEIITSCGNVRFEHFINCAGAYCDCVAHAFGLGKEYKIVPFKGLYWKLQRDCVLNDTIKGNIYPVPNLQNPFLGVHFSRNIYGDVYVGPTAIPAFGREHYGVISGIDREALQILKANAILFFRHPQFRSVAIHEPLKYLKPFFYKDASALVRGLKPGDLVPSNKVGIRPQLINKNTLSLEMDFVMIKDGNTVHVLNPISPAFTASMDLAEKVCNTLESSE